MIGDQLFNDYDEIGRTPLTVFIGYDPREDALAKMLATSIRLKSFKRPVTVVPLVYDWLRVNGLHDRPLDPHGSTQFSITRFLVPALFNRYNTNPGFDRYALFLDCDMICTTDINNIIDDGFMAVDHSFAVSVVKHEYQPVLDRKMGGASQSVYPRKNWSSVMLFRPSHPVLKALDFNTVAIASPKYLHRFEWIDDLHIDEMPTEWNYLVDEPMDEYYYPRMESDEYSGLQVPYIIHYTRGAPIFREVETCKYDDVFYDMWRRTFGKEFDKTVDCVN